jgi:hypothetical protein
MSTLATQGSNALVSMAGFYAEALATEQQRSKQLELLLKQATEHPKFSVDQDVALRALVITARDLLQVIDGPPGISALDNVELLRDALSNAEEQFGLGSR